MNDIYEKAIKKLELARRLSLGPNYTSAEEKKINPNDSLIIKALKEKYQNITDEDVWVKFGARMITTAQKELGVVKDKLSGKIPLMALETNQSLQTWKTELEQILADSNQATIRKLIMLSAGDKKEVIAIAPEVLKENEREELSRLRKENKEFLDKIRNLPPSDKEIISFADALDKLEKVARKLTPPMMDVGTQTDLTAEQITQMEKDIAKYQSDIQTEQEKVNTLTNQITSLQGAIKTLQEQAKDKEPNEAEKELSDYLGKDIYLDDANVYYPNNIWYIELKSKLQGDKWNQLRGEYIQIRKKLISTFEIYDELWKINKDIERLEQDKEELQTKYDMEVRSKEQVVKELRFYRTAPCFSFCHNDDFSLQENQEIFSKHSRSQYLFFGTSQTSSIIEVNNMKFSQTLFLLNNYVYERKIKITGGSYDSKLQRVNLKEMGYDYSRGCFDLSLWEGSKNEIKVIN